MKKMFESLRNHFFGPRAGRNKFLAFAASGVAGVGFSLAVLWQPSSQIELSRQITVTFGVIMLFVFALWWLREEFARERLPLHRWFADALIIVITTFFGLIAVAVFSVQIGQPNIGIMSVLLWFTLVPLALCLLLSRFERLVWLLYGFTLLPSTLWLALVVFAGNAWIRWPTALVYSALVFFGVAVAVWASANEARRLVNHPVRGALARFAVYAILVGPSAWLWLQVSGQLWDAGDTMAALVIGMVSGGLLGGSFQDLDKAIGRLDANMKR